MLKESLQDILEDLARGEDTIHYGELMEAVGLSHGNQGQRSQFAKALKEINTETAEHKGFMLGALVTLKASGIANDSFFKLSEKIGMKDINVSRETFWEEQKNLIYNSY